MADTTPSSVSPFNFGTHAVRVIMQDGNVWFVASDVCAILGVKNHRDSLLHLDDDEKGVVSNDTLGGQQKVSVVNESGLYSLVLRSRKPEAKKFTKWVTSEVLPSIRKTGQYAIPAATAPALPSTITPAQRQELHELVQLIVESGKQTWGETWKRFHNKFRVAKYEQLPAARFEEAKQYLKGKLDAESTIDLIGKHLNDRMPAAMELALAAASGVFTAALKHALTHEDPPSLIRLIASANYVPGQGMKAGVTPIGRDKCVMSFDDMTNAVNEPGGLRLSNTQLLGMLGAVTTKLTSRDTDQHRLAA